MSDTSVNVLSGIALNNNRYFKFNDHIKLSFDISLKPKKDEYLEYLIRLTDINKQEMNIILNFQADSPGELLILCKDKVSKHPIGLKKEEILNTLVPFSFFFDLEHDRLTIDVDDTTFVENRLGLKPHSDYRIVVGTLSDSGNDGYHPSSRLRITNLNCNPNLIEETKTKSRSMSPLLWILIVLIVDVLIFGYIAYRKRKRAKRRENESPSKEDLLFYPEIETDHAVEIHQRAIFLFKQFEVLDRDGNDISSRFTPLLKELFLILLLFSQKESKGISTGELKELLWFDKETQSANNNRAVNIGKLKAILEKVGEFEIVSTSQNVRIHLSDEIYCDYTKILALLNTISLDSEQILELVSIAGRGSFLKEFNYPWLDPFKADLTQKLTDNLINLSELSTVQTNDKLLIQIAETIYNLDDLNEKALSLKCISLVHLEKRSLANAHYNRFIKNYETTYGAPYPFSFTDVVEGKTSGSFARD